MKSKLLIPIIALFAGALLFGTAYSAWAFENSITITNDNIQAEVTDTWTFEGPDYISVDNVSNLTYLTAETETSIVSPESSAEAVRFTNTAGTQSKDHSFIVALDRDYVLRDIKTFKVEFDYYHAKKKNTGLGFPKCQLQYNGSGKGNTHGGGDTVTEKSPFVAYSINEDWWHLEYYVTSMCPTFADHGDRGIAENTVINGVKIVDSTIKDYSGNTAFIVVDNFRLDNTLSPRLGLFNSGTSFKMSKGYYWMKICWAGTLNSVTMTFSDPTLAEHDTNPETKSPFYIHALQPGIFTVTATLDLGEQHQLLSISNEITITDE